MSENEELKKEVEELRKIVEDLKTGSIQFGEYVGLQVNLHSTYLMINIQCRKENYM